MLELEEAVASILAAVPAPQQEEMNLETAHGRVLAQTVSSPIDLPPFDNSAMDGYAVRAEDVIPQNRMLRSRSVWREECLPAKFLRAN
jgi:molybdopterin molybdotransferase